MGCGGGGIEVSCPVAQQLAGHGHVARRDDGRPFAVGRVGPVRQGPCDTGDVQGAEMVFSIRGGRERNIDAPECVEEEMFGEDSVCCRALDDQHRAVHGPSGIWISRVGGGVEAAGEVVSRGVVDGYASTRS